MTKKYKIPDLENQKDGSQNAKPIISPPALDLDFHKFGFGFHWKVMTFELSISALNFRFCLYPLLTDNSYYQDHSEITRWIFLIGLITVYVEAALALYVLWNICVIKRRLDHMKTFSSPFFAEVLSNVVNFLVALGLFVGYLYVGGFRPCALLLILMLLQVTFMKTLDMLFGRICPCLLPPWRRSYEVIDDQDSAA